MGKITEDELAKINAIKQEVTQLVYSLGELEYQKLALEISLDNVKERVKQVRSAESELLSEFRTKYGNVNINIETGDFE